MLTQNIFAENANNARNDLLVALMNKDAAKLVKVLNGLLANIPYDDFSKAATDFISLTDSIMTAREWLYRSTILAFMRGCGVVVLAEIHNNLGRSDLVVAHKDVYWVIELKVAYKGNDPDKKAEEALQQIIDTDYATQHPDPICIGLAIDDAARQIATYRKRPEDK
jgi:hypothetical protein